MGKERPDIVRLARFYVNDPHDTADPHEARQLAQAVLDREAALRECREAREAAEKEVARILSLALGEQEQ